MGLGQREDVADFGLVRSRLRRIVGSGRSRMYGLSNPELRFRAALHLARPTMPARSTKEPEASALAELEELLGMLLESARRLPAGPDRYSILSEILNFNLRLAKLQQRHTPKPAP
jgi:hypothetical protein